MEILQFLLNFILKEYNGGKYQEIFKLLQENSFDVKNILRNGNPETLEPILKTIFSVFSKNQNESPKNYSEESFGLNPIIKIADKEIVYALNKHFAS